MAGGGLHDLFTVFTFKTPPSGDFFYDDEQKGMTGLPKLQRQSRRSRSINVPFSVTRAELDLRASLDGQLRSDMLEAIRRTNSGEDCCRNRRGFASARASIVLL